MKRRILMVLIVVLAAAGVAAFVYTRDRAAEDPGGIRVSGNIEVTEVQLSFRLPGWVAERAVDEGQIVKAGQLAAKLDATELTQDVAQRQAAVAAAKAALDELLAGSRPEEIAASEAAVNRAKAALDELLAGSRPEEIAVAEATVARAKAELELARVDLSRVEESVKSGAVSKGQLDSSRTAYATAETKLNEAEQKLLLAKKGPRSEQIAQARAALAEAEHRYALVKKGPRQETIEQARAKLNEAEQALAIARTRLSYATLKCPVGGVVLSKNVESGEFVAAGTPIVTIGNLHDVWLRAYIRGPDLGKVKVGQKVRITTDSYPGRIYDGRVSFISSEAEFTPKSVQTERERVKLVYRIKIDIDNPKMELKPGMPADAEIVVE